MADADLDLAVEGIIWSAFGTTGQRCTACSRVIVHEAVADDLVKRLVDHAAKLRLGSGLDPTTEVGPLINAGALDKVGRYAEVGSREGRLLIGGARATNEPGLEHGHFYEPTIFDGIAPMDRMAQEEIFGPVLSVIRVPDFDAAVMAANQTRFGLSASIFTRDVNAAFRAMRDLETGHRLRQRGHHRRRDPPAIRRLERDRQRPSRGRPRGARHLHRVEGHLRRLLGPTPARADRQPARLSYRDPPRPKIRRLPDVEAATLGRPSGPSRR